MSQSPAGVRDAAYQNLLTNQVTVQSTATLIAAGIYGRGPITIVNHGATDVYIGTSGVAVGTGILLPGTKGASITLEYAGDIWGIASTGTQVVSYAELF